MKIGFGSKETFIEKVNVFKMNEVDENSYSTICYLEIGESSLAKILLYAVEEVLKIDCMELKRRIMIRISSKDFEKVISSLKTKPLAVENYELIFQLELLLNYAVEGNVHYKFKFLS